MRVLYSNQQFLTNWDIICPSPAGNPKLIRPEELEEYLQEAEQNYFKLLVIPSEPAGEKGIIDFLESRGWSPYDMTREFLRILDSIPRDKWQLRGSIELDRWLSNLPGEKSVFHSVDLLFSPELGKIDPVRTLKYFSRGRRSVLLFPGRINGQRAEFSIEGKPDYMVMDVSEVLCVREQGKGD